MKMIPLILGMALVTYLPRLIPALFMDRINFPGWFERWLKNIPYAALGALIFPGVLLVDRDQPVLGVIGGLTALILSLFNLHIILVMGGAVGMILLLEYFFI